MRRRHLRMYWSPLDTWTVLPVPSARWQSIDDGSFPTSESQSWRRENTPVLDLNELGPVDYVTINHSHFDHTSDLPAVFKENSPIVICDRIFARELSAAYQVPEYNIWPIVRG